MSVRGWAFGVRSYRKLHAWQVGFSLAGQIDTLAAECPPEESWGLTSQTRRAAVSVPSKLAEGAGRASRKELSQFVPIARGALNEMKTQLPPPAQTPGSCQLPDDPPDRIERLHALLDGLRNSHNA